MGRSKARIFLGMSALFIVFIMAGGCVKSESPPNEQAKGDFSTVRGSLNDVQPSSFFGLKSLTLLDEDGNRWDFEGRDVAIPGFAASHLREHMVLGLPIVVTYEDEGGVLVIKDIEDGLEATPP